jgi:hypothetical protein
MSLKLAPVVRDIVLKTVGEEYPFIEDVELKQGIVDKKPIEQYYLEVKVNKEKLGEFVNKRPNNESFWITNVLTDFVVVDPHKQEFVDVYRISNKIVNNLKQLLKMFNITTGNSLSDSVLFVS